uniref:CD209 antigen-like protein C n=1 Tax=Xenopus tropicalis TaxID=8364 RepID=A0A803JQK0_XENTR
MAISASFYSAIYAEMLELKQNKMETKKEYSALYSQMLELKQNITEAKREVVSQLLNVPVKMEERLMAEMTKLKEDMGKYLRKCPENWQFVGSKCYYISTTTLTWEESKNDCSMRNSNLLILKDKKEMDDLQPSLKGKAFWIGMTRNFNAWLWIDSSIPSFTSWAPNEPNNAYFQENCVEIKEGTWNDLNCITKNYYICKETSN